MKGCDWNYSMISFGVGLTSIIEGEINTHILVTMVKGTQWIILIYDTHDIETIQVYVWILTRMNKFDY
jgi:hypothetical protein